MCRRWDCSTTPSASTSSSSAATERTPRKSPGRSTRPWGHRATGRRPRRPSWLTPTGSASTTPSCTTTGTSCSSRSANRGPSRTNRPSPSPSPSREPTAGAVSAFDQPTQVYDAGDLEATDPEAEGEEQADTADAEDAGEPAPDDGDASAEASEDVLEETPEFLQETPEHDRLWFEQKPPRDFDF